MTTIRDLQELSKMLQFSKTATALLHHLSKAKEDQPAYLDFLYDVFAYERKEREFAAYERRMKAASFPYMRTIDDFSLEEQKSLSKHQFNQLISLDWVDQSYNLVLLGPSGIGKTHLSIGLGTKAIKEGFKVMFVSMGEMIRLLKTQEITVKSANKIKRMKDAHSRASANLFWSLAI